MQSKQAVITTGLDFPHDSHDWNGGLMGQMLDDAAGKSCESGGKQVGRHSMNAMREAKMRTWEVDLHPTCPVRLAHEMLLQK